MMNNDRMMVVVRTLEDNRRSGLCEHAVEAGIGLIHSDLHSGGEEAVTLFGRVELLRGDVGRAGS